jgi:cytochrome b561
MLRNQPNRYAAASIAMHWLMLLVVVAAYAFINLREAFPKGSEDYLLMKHWHFVCGLTILLLVILRIGLRLTAGPAPLINPRPAGWMLTSGNLMHLILYAFLLVMPILGWLVLSAGGKQIPFHLPALIATDKPLSHNIKEIHETVGVIGYYLIGLHAAAALFHHYFLKDNTLLRMLPKRTSGK